MSKKIALLLGGLSSEAEVSRSTGQAFAEALQVLGYDFKKIEADHNLMSELLDYKPDIALLALHGKYAEDGTVQSICEFLKIPYSGSGVLASALCMDKLYTKQIFEQKQIPTPAYQYINCQKEKPSKFKLNLSLPVVVKPSRDGSSVGVSIVNELADLVPAIEKARELDYYVLIEDFIDGKEITMPVLGERTLTAIEISPKENFYNYENKYTSGKTDYILPANIDEALARQLSELSLKACEALRVRSYARVDFMLDKANKPYILEINTLPGCTPTSLVPKSAAYEGLAFKDFIQHLIDTATLDYAGVR